MPDGASTAEKRAQPRRARTPASHDPIEIAMEAMVDETGEDNPARILLINQNRLVLRQIASERMGILLKWLIALAVLAAAAVLAGMAWSASQDRSLVIQSFSVPPDLAEQGSTGDAVASHLQDRLAAMSAENQSVAASPELRQFSNATVKLQIPQTGISLGDIDELMRTWLSHRTKVAGEIVHATSGPDKGAVAMTVRAGGEPGVRLVQPDGDLEALLQRAAEHVYEVRSPRIFGQWLGQHGRTDEALALAQRLMRSADRGRRYDGITMGVQVAGNALPLEENIALYRQAFRMRPNGGTPSMNLPGSLVRLGQHEEAYRLFRRAEKMRPAEDSNQTGIGLWPLLARSSAGALNGDYAANLAMMCYLFEVAPCQRDDFVTVALANPRGARAENSSTRLSTAVQSFADAHDVALATRLSALAQLPPPPRSEAANAGYKAGWRSSAVAIDRQREDWAAVLRDAETWDAIAAPWPGLAAAKGNRLWRSYALVKLGRAAEGQAEIAATPLNCYPCLVMRGRVAALTNDKTGAARWFSEAKRQGPSLPMADAAWGQALLGFGDADGAIAHFEAARKTGPRFADPLVFWGEALLAKGDAAGAAAKFEAASAITPRWGRLHLKWGEALAKEGKAAEAKAQWRTAAALELTPDERAELARLH